MAGRANNIFAIGLNEWYNKCGYKKPHNIVGGQTISDNRTQSRESCMRK